MNSGLTNHLTYLQVKWLVNLVTFTVHGRWLVATKRREAPVSNVVEQH